MEIKLKIHKPNNQYTIIRTKSERFIYLSISIYIYISLFTVAFNRTTYSHGKRHNIIIKIKNDDDDFKGRY